MVLPKKEWHTITTKIKNMGDNIEKSVIIDCDEVKAMGEIALLAKDLEEFVRKNWVQSEVKDGWLCGGRLKQ